MNIRDLRPGNLIRWVQTNEIVTVTGVFEDKREVTARKADGTNVEDIIDAFEGVGLTEKFLEDSAGFEKDYAYPKYFIKKYLLKPEAEIKSEVEVWVSVKHLECFIQDSYNEREPARLKKKMEYLHHLQNLWRDLTDEELEIKL